MILLALTVMVCIWMSLIWILYFLADFTSPELGSKKFPIVSILISIRNEERNIHRLMNSLTALTYPKAKFEIIIGDDGSTDQSIELVQELLPVNGTLYEFRSNVRFGKQFVLSQLAKRSKGQFLLFTDADMSFGPDWIQGMVNHADGALKVGMTKVDANNFSSKLETMDMAFHQSLIALFSRFHIPITAWGNNMILDRKLYDEIGGFESLKPSIVEDVNLMRAIVSVGGEVKIALSDAVLATTQGTHSMLDLLHQRKRWMAGVDKSPLILKLGMLIKLLYLPSITVLVVSNPWLIIIPIVKLIGSWLLFNRISKVIQSRFSVIVYLVYEFYDFAFYLVTFAFYFLPIPVRWKGRIYN